MYLIAQKWRGSLVISTMRLVANEDVVRDHFAWLKKSRDTGPWATGVIMNTRYWFVWTVSADADPVLCKELLKEVR